MVRKTRRVRRRVQPVRARPLPRAGQPARRVLFDIAEAHGATAHQVALRFLVRRLSVFAIPKASTPGHAENNAGAGDLRLSRDELRRIDQAFPLGPRPAELPAL